jgi:hypothetical protein
MQRKSCTLSANCWSPVSFFLRIFIQTTDGRLVAGYADFSLRSFPEPVWAGVFSSRSASTGSKPHTERSSKPNQIPLCSLLFVLLMDTFFFFHSRLGVYRQASWRANLGDPALAQPAGQADRNLLRPRPPSQDLYCGPAQDLLVTVR